MKKKDRRLWTFSENRAYYDKLRKKIKKKQKDKQCWKCGNFNGYYFDAVTFDCLVLGDNQMWDFEGINCEYFKTSKKG